jgi:hypothetical protein
MPSFLVPLHEQVITGTALPPAGFAPGSLAASADGRGAGIHAGTALAAILSGGGTRPLTRPQVDECACVAIDAGLKSAIGANVAARLSACMAAVIPYSLLSPAGARVACEAARRLLPAAADTACVAVRDQALQAGLCALANIPSQTDPTHLHALLDTAVAAGLSASVEQGSRKALRAAVVGGMDIGLRTQTIPPASQRPVLAAFPHASC